MLPGNFPKADVSWKITANVMEKPVIIAENDNRTFTIDKATLLNIWIYMPNSGHFPNSIMNSIQDKKMDQAATCLWTTIVSGCSGILENIKTAEVDMANNFT